MVKESTKARMKGKFLELKGKIKEKLAWASEDHRREQEGKNEKLGGQALQKTAETETESNH